MATKAIDRKGKKAGWSPKLERVALHEERKTDNRQRILRRPEIVLDLVSREMSVFTERDIARVLHRYVDDAGTFQHLMARILQNRKRSGWRVSASHLRPASASPPSTRRAS
ncbi:Ti-type conjugative transfer relaxase TraA (plasmid) [Bradyrhizobium diazoefficiens]|uniref:Ti-type conjugative transfer relaxase TraA n=1 Tax=Bradyrhizobium diazoefficiens TaxID=1355477 RepID=A0A0E3VY32_9BRAD|nr:Ti-type conjugative transfer relaxase TraA [Bradyrhizobium diazoefficiens]